MENIVNIRIVNCFLMKQVVIIVCSIPNMKFIRYSIHIRTWFFFLRSWKIALSKLVIQSKASAFIYIEIVVYIWETWWNWFRSKVNINFIEHSIQEQIEKRNMKTNILLWNENVSDNFNFITWIENNLWFEHFFLVLNQICYTFIACQMLSNWKYFKWL